MKTLIIILGLLSILILIGLYLSIKWHLKHAKEITQEDDPNFEEELFKWFNKESRENQKFISKLNDVKKKYTEYELNKN